MKASTVAGCWFAIIVLLPGTGWGQGAERERRARGLERATVAAPPAAPTRLSGVEQLLEVLDGEIARAAPRGMSREELAAWNEQTAWLRSVRDRYAAHARTIRGGTSTDAALRELEAAVMREAEQRPSQTNNIANMQKARHDTAKNAISNVR